MSSELQITLSPEVADLVVKEAARQGTSADRVVNEAVRDRYGGVAGDQALPVPRSLADALRPYIGVVETDDLHLSEKCGEKFTDILIEKQQRKNP